MTEEQHYEAVLDEASKEPRRKGLWAKALALCDGDQTRAEHCYIKLRVEQRIAEETEKQQFAATVQAQLQETKTRERSAQLRAIRSRWIVFFAILGAMTWIASATTSINSALSETIPKFFVNCLWTVIPALVFSEGTSKSPRFWRNYLITLGLVEAIHALGILLKA